MSRNRIGIAAVLMAWAAFACGTGLVFADAAFSVPYTPLSTFKVPGARGIAVEASTGDVFVVDAEEKKVVKLDAVGTKVEGEFTGSTGGTKTPEGELKNPFGIAVDDSGGSSAGDVYVAAGGNVVDKFRPKAPGSNEYEYECEPIGVAAGCPMGGIPEEYTIRGVAVDSNGDLYAGFWNTSGPLVFELGSEGQRLPFSPARDQNGKNPEESPFGVAVDSSGEVYVASKLESSGPTNVLKFNALGELQEEPVLEANQGAAAVAVDSATGEVFVVDAYRSNKIGEPVEYHVDRYALEGGTLKDVEEFGGGEIGESVGIAFAPGNGDVYVTDEKNGEVHVYAKSSGGLPPEITGCETKNPTATSVTLVCTVNPNAAEANWHFEYSTGGGSYKSTPEPEGTITSTGPVEVEIENLEPQSKYVYRLKASNKQGVKSSGELTFTTLPAVMGVTACTGSSVRAESATLEASFNSGGLASRYFFQYGTNPAYGSSTSIRESSSPLVEADVPVLGLEPNRTYDCRLVATNTIGTTYGENGTFQTPATKPDVVGEWSADIGLSAVGLYATIDPENSETTYYVEYVDAANFCPTACPDSYEHGERTPAGEVGSNIAYHTVRAELEGLAPGTTYHYRVVAANSASQGTSYGEDQTFTTAGMNPPVVTTGPAGGVTQTTATLSGTVDPGGYATTYVFEIGTTEEYGSDISGELEGPDTGPQSVTLTLESLAPVTTYYYRLSATNANGTSLGEPGGRFTTPGLAYSLTLPLTLPLLAVPPIAFPPKVKPPPALTNAQKLAKALKACRKKPRHKRAACEKQARKTYEKATKGASKTAK